MGRTPPPPTGLVSTVLRGTPVGGRRTRRGKREAVVCEGKGQEVRLVKESWRRKEDKVDDGINDSDDSC